MEQSTSKDSQFTNCPECGSSNISTRIVYPISNEGHLPKSPVDFCFDCEFKSEETFLSLNFKSFRDYKLQQILKSDGF